MGDACLNRCFKVSIRFVVKFIYRTDERSGKIIHFAVIVSFILSLFIYLLQVLYQYILMIFCDIKVQFSLIA